MYVDALNGAMTQCCNDAGDPVLKKVVKGKGARHRGGKRPLPPRNTPPTIDTECARPPDGAVLALGVDEEGSCRHAAATRALWELAPDLPLHRLLPPP